MASHRTHLNTYIDHESIVCADPLTKDIVSRIHYEVQRGECPYRAEYHGELTGVQGRKFRNLKAAEYAVLSEYVNLNTH